MGQAAGRAAGAMQMIDGAQKCSNFYDYTSTLWICEINCKCLAYVK